MILQLKSRYSDEIAFIVYQYPEHGWGRMIELVPVPLHLTSFFF